MGMGKYLYCFELYNYTSYSVTNHCESKHLRAVVCLIADTVQVSVQL